MNWFLIINDAQCKKEFDRFLKKNAKAVVVKTEISKAFKNIERVLNSTHSVDSGLIAINSASNVSLIKVNDIVYCQSNRSYTQVHLSNGTKLTVTKTLKQFETILNKHRFARIHMSHLVNVNYIVKYVKGEGGYVMLTDDTKLPVATRKKEFLFRELEKL